MNLKKKTPFYTLITILFAILFCFDTSIINVYAQILPLKYVVKTSHPFNRAV